MVGVAVVTQAGERKSATLVESAAPSAAAPSAPIATARIRDVPAATPPPSPTPAPPNTDPVALAADPRAGVIAGGFMGSWRYDGRSGTMAIDQSGPSARLAYSPSGRWMLESRNVSNGSFIERTDVWLIDARTGAERLLYVPPELPPSFGKNVQPNPNIPPYPFQRTEYAGAWSPDEHYVLLWRVDHKSASSPDGLPLLVINVETGAQTDLGYTLLYFVTWRPPHTLAYVAGAGRETWKDKTLSIWSPETGSRRLTSPDRVGIAPAWGPDGRLWFVDGAAGPYDVPTFFAGHGIGDRTIYSLDLTTGSRSALPRATGYADEGVRISSDGKTILIERRKLDPNARSGQSPDSWLELWIANVDGSDAKALFKMSAVNGFGYYGQYGSLAILDWTR
jgi:hypothetical protein